MGAIGSGATFRRNIEALKSYKLTTRLIHDVYNPDTSCDFLGVPLALPLMTAPITGAVTNMGGAIDELQYNQAVVKGSIDAGTIAFVGDGATPDKYKIGLQALNDNKGLGIPIFKPRSDNNEILKRIKAAKKAGAFAVGIDIDAIVFKTMAMKNQSVGPKSPEKLKELINAADLPFVLKGIMSPRDAETALKAGASALIVSNHGGRVLDEMLGTMDVLSDIISAVGNDIPVVVDGGFRSAVDIVKALALGAHSVLIGRPIAIAAVGKGAEGTAFYLNKMKQDLQKAMILTGCSTLKDIDQSLVVKI